MSWWVYEDDVTKHVRVHEAARGHCNEGRGHRGSRLPDNRWHGTFRTMQAAIDKALSTGHEDVGGCGVCLRELGALR